MKTDKNPEITPIRARIGAACIALAATFGAVAPAVAQSLGTARTYGVLAASTVTNTGVTVVQGDLGLSPGTAVVGFPPGSVTGTIHAADAAALQAQSDLTIAYNAVASQACGNTVTGDLGGRTLAPGVYCSPSSAQLTGTLTLDAGGNANAVFIFKIGSALTVASGARVVLINGASACNLFWQVGSSATVGTGAAIAGNILALTSITLNTGASLLGRALARTGAVTLDTNAVTVPAGCAPAPLCPAITLLPSSLPTASVGVAYSQALTVAPAGTYTFSIISGALPAGLTLGASTGLISGTPTGPSSPGPVTILALSAAGCSGAVILSLAVIGDAIPVPTLSEWAMIFLALMLSLVGFTAIRRRSS